MSILKVSEMLIFINKKMCKKCKEKNHIDETKKNFYITKLSGSVGMNRPYKYFKNTDVESGKLYIELKTVTLYRYDKPELGKWNKITFEKVYGFFCRDNIFSDNDYKYSIPSNGDTLMSNRLDNGEKVVDFCMYYNNGWWNQFTIDSPEILKFNIFFHPLSVSKITRIFFTTYFNYFYVTGMDHNIHEMKYQ